jgi:hypothetical protein
MDCGIDKYNQTSYIRKNSMAFNYSIEVIKKSMFIDELNSRLKIMKDIDNNKDNDLEVIINYLEKRIAEIIEQEKKMFLPN